MTGAQWLFWAGAVLFAAAFGVWAHGKGEQAGYEDGYCDAVNHTEVWVLDAHHRAGDHVGGAYPAPGCRLCNDRGGEVTA